MLGVWLPVLILRLQHALSVDGHQILYSGYFSGGGGNIFVVFVVER